MRKSEFTPPHIQKAIDNKERLLSARVLAEGEKTVVAQSDALYHGKSSFRDEVDTKELQSYMNLD